MANRTAADVAALSAALFDHTGAVASETKLFVRTFESRTADADAHRIGALTNRGLEPPPDDAAGALTVAADKLGAAAAAAKEALERLAAADRERRDQAGAAEAKRKAERDEAGAAAAGVRQQAEEAFNTEIRKLQQPGGQQAGVARVAVAQGDGKDGEGAAEGPTAAGTAGGAGDAEKGNDDART